VSRRQALLVFCALLLGCRERAQSRSQAAPVDQTTDAHDHSSHAIEARTLAPRVVALDAAARARASSLYISSPSDGVTVTRGPDGWVTDGAPSCAVPAERVERALARLSELSSLATTDSIQSGADFHLKIVVYAGTEKLLKLALGPRTARGYLVQLDDYSARELLGFEPELFPAAPGAWCGQP
jgi:hypothetical protein